MGRLTASVSPDEERRLSRLHSYSVLDTPRELLFDRFVFTVAQLFRVPVAVIGLFDAHRYWLKAHVGLPIGEVARGTSLCGTLLESGDSLVVEDLRIATGFSEHPLVTGAPFLRFFAAVPLITPDGVRLGTLCVADRIAKSLLDRQIVQLQDAGRSVARALEARRLPDV